MCNLSFYLYHLGRVILYAYLLHMPGDPPDDGHADDAAVVSPHTVMEKWKLYK